MIDVISLNDASRIKIGNNMAEDHITRLKRLRLRSWRRGIKEMDLILGEFADTEMKFLTKEQLDQHEMMMAEHDHDLYQWISGQSEVPAELKDAISRVYECFVKNKA